MKIQLELVSTLLADEDNAATALAQLSNFWSTRAQMGEDGQLTGLSAPERAAHLMLWYTYEVANGGHSQYFYNPIGAFAHETVAALDEIGLNEVSAILVRAFNAFPNRTVPAERVSRCEALRALSGTAKAELNSADRALYALDQDTVDVAVLRYLRQHKDDVLRPEQG